MRKRLRDSPTPSPSSIDDPLQYRRVEEDNAVGSASENRDVSFSEESLETTTLEGSRRTLKVAPPLPILAVHCHDWGIVFYIRTDRGRSVHTYPHVGGPFKSQQEAQKAIDTFLHARQDPTMFMDGLSHVEMSVKWNLYWPDGTRKTPSKSDKVDVIRNWTHHLAQALVDEYNEQHDLKEDRAHQVKEVVRIESICEGNLLKWYKHINFTTMAKGVDHVITTNLFFAEVISTKGELEELVPSCLRMLESSDNGTCHGCQNNGSGQHMKHPNDASAYTGGHVRDTFFASGGRPELPPMAYPAGDEDELHRAEEARLRATFTDYEDARVFEEYKDPYPPSPNWGEPPPETEELRQLWLFIESSS